MSSPTSPAAPPSPAHKWIRRTAFGVSVLCFAWVLWPLWRHGRELTETLAGGALLRATLLGAGLYTLLSVLLALAWWWLAGIYGERLPVRSGYAVFARSQLAKYLPGNAFHYVSRQLLGRQAGLSHPALVASGLLELGSLVLAALCLTVLGFGLSRSAVSPPLAWPWAVLLGAGSLLAWPGLDQLLRRLPWTARAMRGLPRLSPAGTLRLLGPSLGLHALFFLGTGVLLVALLASSRSSAPTELWRLLWVYPVAWLAGTVTVGAPAGVGVREAVLALQMEPLVGDVHAAAVALAFRLVTTSGDLLSAALGWGLRQ